MFFKSSDISYTSPKEPTYMLSEDATFTKLPIVLPYRVKKNSWS